MGQKKRRPSGYEVSAPASQPLRAHVRHVMELDWTRGIGGVGNMPVPVIAQAQRKLRAHVQMSLAHTGASAGAPRCSVRHAPCCTRGSTLLRFEVFGSCQPLFQVFSMCKMWWPCSLSLPCASEWPRAVGCPLVPGTCELGFCPVSLDTSSDLTEAP